MKNKSFIVTMSLVAASLWLPACKKSDFANAYIDPKTVAATTVENQFAGVLTSNLDYVMYKYWNYFVVMQNTCLPWTQAVGVLNSNGRYVPGAAAISDRWKTFYNFVAQYKELLRVYAGLSADDQAKKRFYIIAATIFYYDQSQKVVDLHGDIPWSQAGLLSTNNGNYQASYAKYDKAADIYTKMLDDLKGFADELNTIKVSDAVKSVAQSQDFVNKADLTLWKKYCNSLRLRLLMRVSGATAFQSRVNTEIAAITGNAASYPLITSNADNMMIKVTNKTGVTAGINNGTGTGADADFYKGLIGWGGGDVPSKAMIDYMNAAGDPRLRAMFQPGTATGGAYVGLDPTLAQNVQNDLVNAGKVSRYNWSTLSRNTYLPGMLVSASEINFLLAEYYLNAGNNTAAKAAYENGINQSVDYYFWVRTLSDDNSQGALTAVTATEKSTLLRQANVDWDLAASNTAKLTLIATQKWINFSVLEPIESWSEIRRLKLPALTFTADNTNVQTMPPSRWVYPANEVAYNPDNYASVQANDKLTTKLFWDVK